MTMRIGGILAAAVLIAAALPARAQETYPTPEAAVKDLVDSAKAKTPGFGDRILGKDGAALLRSGDADQDAENLKEFNEAAAASTAIDDGPEWHENPTRREERLDLAAAAHQDRRGLALRRRQRKGGNDQSPGRLQRAQRH